MRYKDTVLLVQAIRITCNIVSKRFRDLYDPKAFFLSLTLSTAKKFQDTAVMLFKYVKLTIAAKTDNLLFGADFTKRLSAV